MTSLEKIGFLVLERVFFIGKRMSKSLGEIQLLWCQSDAMHWFIDMSHCHRYLWIIHLMILPIREFSMSIQEICIGH